MSMFMDLMQYGEVVTEARHIRAGDIGREITRRELIPEPIPEEAPQKENAPVTEPVLVPA